MNRRAFTLIELLVTMVIGVIAMFGLAAPLVAERNFWNTGKRQTEAQRDAQTAMRAIERVAREGIACPVSGSGSVAFQVPCDRFGVINPPSANVLFSSQNGQLQMTNACLGGVTSILIDGVRSRVASFISTPIITNRLVRIQLQVAHRLHQNNPREEDELLVTELFLRNNG